MYRVGLCFSDASRSFAAGPLLGAASSWETRCRGIPRAATLADEPDGTIAVGHAPHPGRTDLRLSELLTCAVRDLVRSARRNRRAL